MTDPPYSRFITTTTNEIVTPRNQFLSPKGLTFLHECIYKYGIALFDRFKDLPPVVRNGIGLFHALESFPSVYSPTNRI